MPCAAVDMPSSTATWVPACSRYASPDEPNQSATSALSRATKSCRAASVNAATLFQVAACAATSSALPASQSRASLSGLTCSISHDTPQETSEPSGSIAIDRMSNDPPTPPRVPSTQLLLWMPPATWAASSTRPSPVYHVVESCASATSALLIAAALAADRRVAQL